MTTFITGATTNLGRVLVRELVNQGEAVRLLVRPDSNRAGLELPGVEFIRGDINDSVVVRKGIIGCDWVCHLAMAGPRTSDADRQRVNVEGTRTLLQAAQDMRARSVVTVSDLALLGPAARKARGREDDDAPMDENCRRDLARPSAPYLQSLWAVDQLVDEFAAGELNVKLVYPGAGFGYVRPPGGGGLADYTLLRMAAGRPVAVPGKGRNRLAPGYFLDVARGVILAHERGRAGQAYILAAEPVTWLDFWAAVADVLEKPAPKRRLPIWLARMLGMMPAPVAAWAGQDWHYTGAKARRQLGWHPRSVLQALEETWAACQAAGFETQATPPERVARRV